MTYSGERVLHLLPREREARPKGRDLGIITRKIEKVTKSVRGMPWLSEARKDVISCDKLRGGANNP